MAILRICSLSAALLLRAYGSPMHIAKLCRAQTCTDPKFPLLDYVPEQDLCVCRAHPCWNDNGRVHDCSLESGLHLTFGYTHDGKLTCSCSATPQDSTFHMAHDLCPGQQCALPDFPLLDWDPDEKRCLCRSNPCWNEPGVPEKCKDPLFPMLAYREDVDPVSGAPKAVCECKARANKPKPKTTTTNNLRGASAEGRSEIVTLANGDRCATPTIGHRSSTPS
jgi:hypothetical protein